MKVVKRFLAVLTVLLLSLMMTSTVYAEPESGSESGGSIPGLIGLSSGYMGSGIGAGFLTTLLGADLVNRVTFDIGGEEGAITPGGAGFTGSENPIFQGVLKFGAYLGAAMTSLFLLLHGVIMGFNKMEYGDLLGEAKERAIGGLRIALAFGLVMPISAQGLSTGQHMVGYVAVASNGIGNKMAETVVLHGFGSASSEVNVFSYDNDFNSAGSAEVFAEMVGQHSCRSYMRTINASPQEARKNCQTYAIGGSEDELDVGYDSGSAASASDADYCAGKHSSSTFRDGTDVYLDNACRGIRQAQRQAYDRVQDLYEEYDGDLSSDEAFNKLQTIAGDMNSSIGEQIKEINQGMFSDSEGDYAGGNHFSNQMVEFTKHAGWPGLGVLYSTIGGQMDAISGLQADNSTSASGFNIDRMGEVGRQTISATRRVQNDQGRALGAANAAGLDGVDLGADDRGILGATGDVLGNGLEVVTAGVSDGAAWVYRELLFAPLFDDPGPVATHKLGSTILGTALVGAALVDVAKLLPAGKAIDGASKIGEIFSNTLSKVKGNGASDTSSGGMFSGDGASILINILVMFIATLLMLMLLIAFFLVAILPKLPIFFVTFLALEWAIWCAIIIFATPLWLALNLTAIGNQPGLFTQRALSGLGVLAYVLLFPALVVVAVVISVLAYNLIIPVLAGLLLLAFGGGLMDMIIGIFATPVVLLLAMAIGGYISITAISRIPPMITNFLGIQAPGSSVSDSINNFIASPMQYNNTSNPMSMIPKGPGKGVK